MKKVFILLAVVLTLTACSLSDNKANGSISPNCIYQDTYTIDGYVNNGENVYYTGNAFQDSTIVINQPYDAETEMQVGSTYLITWEYEFLDYPADIFKTDDDGNYIYNQMISSLIRYYPFTTFEEVTPEGLDNYSSLSCGY